MRSISHSFRFAAAAVGLALACAYMPASAAELAASTFNPHGFTLPAGTYRCDLNRSVDVAQVSPDMQSAVLRFDRKEYKMHAVAARSGALRYEDASSGLVWLVIVGKSMLLDTRHGRQLANDCKA